jgi:glutamate synthase domain-containing protein 3
MSTQTETAIAIDAAGLHYREFNERIHEALDNGATELILQNVCGQRYIGAGLDVDVRITVEGVPGNDLACFMDGPQITVHGNAQDGVANTMSSGAIAVHGHAGDVVAYAMRGGRVFIEGNAGYRVGIHMKEYKTRVPVVIIGGTARDYFGEYMAGGTLVLLGLGRKAEEPLAGDFLGTGMHGGQILLRGQVEDWQLGKEVGRVELDDDCWAGLSLNLREFAEEFGLSPESFRREEFTRLMPVSHRPYGKIYVY